MANEFSAIENEKSGANRMKMGCVLIPALIKEKLILSVQMAQDFTLYLRHKLSGTPYFKYYSERMDRIVKRNPNWGLNLEREFQLKYLQKQGMKQSDSLLDYGCGAISAGRHFIDFLDRGNYVGVDVSPAVVQEAKNRVSRFGLLDKEPTLFCIFEGSLAIVGPRKFRFIWAQSVLTHMSPQDILSLLCDIQQFMAADSEFFATFTESATDDIHHRHLRDWSYPLSFFEKAGLQNGLSVSFVKDWMHPNDPSGRDRMVVFRLKKE
ncbi:MAG: class I SAM-dependent methyltransferase [Bdellovibrionales bacterium]|nr:class I SAM-dependent methyltransferase [Bdellovibrionales bacterium]